MITSRTGQQRHGGGVAQFVDLVIDGRVLLDEGIGVGQVGLRLVVVVVGDKEFHRVVREQFLELAVQLGCQGLVGGQHQGRSAGAGNHVGHGKGLAGAGYPQQHLVFVAPLDPGHQFINRLGLVTAGGVRSGEFELGPLPYVILKSSYPQAEPVAAINEPDGKATYTCAMVTAFDGPTSVKQVHRSIAFSQPLSTCGHLTAGYLLAKYGVKLEALHHEYLGNQDQVALSVVKGNYEVGTIKTAVAKKYANLTLRVIEETPPFPGFVLVANKATLTPDQIKEMSRALLSSSSKDRATLMLGRHGFAPVVDAHYDLIRQNMRFSR
jgi:hypothetical protein